MAWSEQDSIDYWNKRFPSTREQLISDLPKDEYESEYPITESDQSLEFQRIHIRATRTDNAQLVDTYPKLEDHYQVTDENDVIDWRILP